MMDLTQPQWVRHVVFHPFEGFEDLRWKKGGTLKYTVIIIIALFFSMIAFDRSVRCPMRCSRSCRI